MEVNFPKIEEKILKFWEENKIFEKLIEQRKKAKDFVFYEGPPTANARAGLHHVLARVFKDIICRYKTMRGFRVLRKAGWDTHGLPVELEIEKKLGLKNKKDIEKYGIARFNKKCKESVWQYKEDWEKLTERIGFWLDMKNPYITYDNDYIETIWWITKQIHEKGLLYKDYKVVPYCPRCGTSLSTHEVALGYKKIKEPAIYIKFPISNSQFPKTSFLVWTTTPWTLPGNVAIAVNPAFIYAKLRANDEYLILAKDRIEVCQIKGEVQQELKGEELIGLNYEPLFPTEVGPLLAYKVIGANFVSLEEGTGLVHIAPAFGEEDMEVIKMQNAKCKMQNLPEFPILVNVDEEGKFKPKVKQWAGMFVKEADPLIIEDLRKRNLLFKEEIYEHDYPFCWRCDSPLLYYAKESWFIKMTTLKDKLIENNQKINWVPAHLKEGRFGEWLSEIKDWALSRERYWGTPLLIWQCKNCRNLEVIGSKKDLVSQKYSKNQYLILRHSETAYQKEKILYDWPAISSFPLTEDGKKKIENLAKKLKKEKPDLIYSSDALRARQTAEIVAKELKIQINFDSRLRDINLGIYQWRKKDEFLKDFPVSLERFKKKVPEGESWSDVKKRVIDFIKDIDEKYEGKKILIVSHGDPLWLLEGAMKGLEDKEFLEQKFKKKCIKIGEIRKIDFKNLPYNEEGELDFHRPFIDEVKFYCQNCGHLMERENEVVDCWFDSGAMPFGQAHWPFEQKEKEKPPRLFPADYISEGVDQTRGWFYTLLAISTLLDFGPSFKNVISLGLVLDEKGEKMSKSKGNVVDPWKMIEKYGADSLRWYFFTVNQPGENKLFSEKEVFESLKKFLMTFWNCFLFFKTYAVKTQNSKPKSKNVLDKWIISKLNNLINQVTRYLDNYDVTLTSRIIEKFLIEDFSQWYIRRSRRRFQKPEDERELKEASETLGFILLTLTKLTAPFIPFLSEEIYQNYEAGSRSIHLEDWPKANKKLIDRKIEKKMDLVRKIVGLGLKARAKVKIKIRQPLSKLQIVNYKLENEFLDLIKEEINAKEIEFVREIREEKGWVIEGDGELKIALNTKIIPKLKEEGILREFIHQVQEARKREGLTPKDKISIYFSANPELTEILIKNEKFILKETKAKKLQILKELKSAQEIKIDQGKLWLAIKKL